MCPCVAPCRPAAPEGGDHEDAGPDTAAGTHAQQQVRGILPQTGKEYFISCVSVCVTIQSLKRPS